MKNVNNTKENLKYPKTFLKHDFHSNSNYNILPENVL